MQIFSRLAEIVEGEGGLTWRKPDAGAGSCGVFSWCRSHEGGGGSGVTHVCEFVTVERLGAPVLTIRVIQYVTHDRRNIAPMVLDLVVYDAEGNPLPDQGTSLNLLEADTFRSLC